MWWHDSHQIKAGLLVSYQLTAVSGGSFLSYAVNKIAWRYTQWEMGPDRFPLLFGLFTKCLFYFVSIAKKLSTTNKALAKRSSETCRNIFQVCLDIYGQFHFLFLEEQFTLIFIKKRRRNIKAVFSYFFCFNQTTYFQPDLIWCDFPFNLLLLTPLNLRQNWTLLIK